MNPFNHHTEIPIGHQQKQLQLIQVEKKCAMAKKVYIFFMYVCTYTENADDMVE